MLALLQKTPGVAPAEIDHAGLVLRVRCSSPGDADRCITDARQRLGDAGFETHLLQGAAQQAVLDGVTRWYDLETIDELSVEERMTLAERSAPDAGE